MILTISKILGNTPKSVSNWKNEKRPIISLLYKYFTKQELEEFLETDKIDKFESLKTTNDFLDAYKKKYFNFINVKMGHINSLSEYQLQFYFSYLFFIRAHHSKFSIHSHPFCASLSRFALDCKEDVSSYDKDSLHIVYDIVDFLENEKMWDYFVFLLKNDLKHFVEGINLNDYYEEDGMTLKTDSIENNHDGEEFSDEECEEYLKLKHPLNIDGFDHYWLYHEYNYQKLKLYKRL